MARKSQTFTATFHRAERIGCSVNGNPTFLLHTSEGTYRTQSDASIGYEINNHDRRPEHTADGWRGREVTFTATPAGRVWDWHLTCPSYALGSAMTCYLREGHDGQHQSLGGGRWQNRYSANT